MKPGNSPSGRTKNRGTVTRRRFALTDHAAEEDAVFGRLHPGGFSRSVHLSLARCALCEMISH
jgi:hypothetical protein